MSLYADYILEREGKLMVEDANGFASFAIANEECYIENIYVVPGKRLSGLASKYADQIVEIAKDKGCKYLTGSVKPSANGSTESMKALLGYGFKLLSASHDAIFFIKEI